MFFFLPLNICQNAALWRGLSDLVYVFLIGCMLLFFFTWKVRSYSGLNAVFFTSDFTVDFISSKPNIFLSSHDFMQVFSLSIDGKPALSTLIVQVYHIEIGSCGSALMRMETSRVSDEVQGLFPHQADSGWVHSILLTLTLLWSILVAILPQTRTWNTHLNYLVSSLQYLTLTEIKVWNIWSLFIANLYLNFTS